MNKPAPWRRERSMAIAEATGYSPPAPRVTSLGLSQTWGRRFERPHFVRWASVLVLP